MALIICLAMALMALTSFFFIPHVTTPISSTVLLYYCKYVILDILDNKLLENGLKTFCPNRRKSKKRLLNNQNLVIVFPLDVGYSHV